MCTAALQKSLPDFMTNLQGTTVQTGADMKTGPRPIRNGTDVPLGDTRGADEISIRQRREKIRQAQENPGSNIPNPIRTRRDIMDEIT